MDISTITELVSQNPACYFVAGLVVGYFMRNPHFNDRAKRPGRYQVSVKSSHEKHAVVMPGSNEPYFDWADAAVKSLTSRQNTVALHQSSEEI